MQPSADLCRARAAHHDAVARGATLDNVRLIASAAAAAWAKEGAAADIREDRRLRTQAFAAAPMLPIEPPSAALRGLSENPDRGHADRA
ncbi:hypothetical protein ACNFJ7_02590 [Sphingomonas sp. HT-1]|uniref:hypothetical protein n=1 Tax=unclassified Sphingomonas TaxID=196159 RepID=UPI00031C00BB|nr:MULTISPECIES: hypothetical protein [unclassified Sphingomonas]KTF69030.1 hypothetical protein ATB93_11260 [Sphingomonas sp. WG]